MECRPDVIIGGFATERERGRERTVSADGRAGQRLEAAMWEPNSFAVARFALADRVSARDMYRFVALIENFYSWHVLLDHMDTELVAEPTSFLPDEAEELLVNSLEVGSPNHVDLMGLVQPLVDTLAWMGTVTGTSLTAVKIWNGYWKGRKARAEALKIELELEQARKENRLEDVQAEELARQPNLLTRTQQHKSAFTPEELQYKEEFLRYSASTAEELVPKFASAPMIIVFTNNLSN